jgi:hypothetical protein
MRPLPRAPITIVTLLAIAAGSVALRAPAAEGSAQAETRRIQAHFDSVLTELAASPAPVRDARHVARRASLIRELTRYRDRGVFPHNYDFPGRAVPYFVDRKTGTLCAVANLLAATGRRDIVDRVARADNNVRVAQLAGDTAFVRWLDVNGLTLAEAARIQVPYVVEETAGQKARNDVFYLVAPLSVGTSIAASLWNTTSNADGHDRVGNVLGFVSSALTLGVGATTAGKYGVPKIVPFSSVALGTLGLTLSTRGIVRRQRLLGAQQSTPPAQPPAREVSVAPIISGRGGAGVSFAMRF